ncbi:MAG: restriction endonuclease subunit S [Flavobacteriaceae bacterium]|nr:restriction endonuclease subunit S [Flavobacteriaceae bacterium]
MIEFVKKLLNGQAVEWKTLGEVCEIGTGQSINKRVISNNIGNYPVINSGREPLGFINKWNTDDDPIGITSRGAGVGSITWQEGKYFRGNLNYSVTHNKEEVNTRFLYHILLEYQREIQSLCTFVGIPALNASNLKTLKIPLPPLSVQRKIADILDKFTELKDNLNMELNKELGLRKKQYAYYREKLLTFDQNTPRKTLREVAKIKNGKDWKKLNSGNIPVYGSGGVMGYVDTFAYDKPSVLIPRKGSITNLFYLEQPFWNVDTIYYTEIDTNQIIPKYFYYFMKTIDLMALDTGSGRPSLTQAILNEIKIPLPPLEEQQRIVGILDQFDKLINDISEGIPAEIHAREKQFQYYREKLLSFDVC